MITGTHALIHSDHAEEIRTFFRDTLKLPHVDAGHGWLIFCLPPAEIGMHPAEKGKPLRTLPALRRHQLHRRRSRKTWRKIQQPDHRRPLRFRHLHHATRRRRTRPLPAKAPARPAVAQTQTHTKPRERETLQRETTPKAPPLNLRAKQIRPIAIHRPPRLS